MALSYIWMLAVFVARNTSWGEDSFAFVIEKAHLENRLQRKGPGRDLHDFCFLLLHSPPRGVSIEQCAGAVRSQLRRIEHLRAAELRAETKAARILECEEAAAHAINMTIVFGGGDRATSKWVLEAALDRGRPRNAVAPAAMYYCTKRYGWRGLTTAMALFDPENAGSAKMLFGLVAQYGNRSDYESLEVLHTRYGKNYDDPTEQLLKYFKGDLKSRVDKEDEMRKRVPVATKP